MKLVDILARELKAWPKGALLIVQDSDASINPCTNPNRDLSIESGIWTSTNGFMVGLDVTPGMMELAEDYATATVIEDEWQAAVDAPKAEEITYSSENVSIDAPYISLGQSSVNPECKIIQAAWTGEGLPPVGTTCEISLKASVDHENTVDGARYFDHDGEQVTIVAHHKIDDSSSAAVYAVLKSFSYEYHSLCEGNFKPIRTPEQIAADQRMAAAYAMCAIAPTLSNVDAVALYDAGYRKQEAK